MYKFGIVLIFSVLISFAVNAKTIDQKKEELKKIYEAGGISKLEYEKGIESLEKPKGQNKKIKKSFSFKKKAEKNTRNLIGKVMKKDKEEITLEKIEELGKPVKFDDTYYTKGMIKKFKSCNNSFKCRGDKAGKELFNTFNKRNKAWQQQNPGQMIKTMAMFEVFYSSKLWYARKALERYKKDEYEGLPLRKKKDEKEIRSLLGLYKGRNSMREALGMTPEIPSQEAIKKFWLLGEFLDLGTGVKNKKLASDLKKRQELLTAYKNQISKLKKKLQDDTEEDENEKSVE